MAARILCFEDDRATSPASLRVRRLPAADKGGDYEICGICDGIEPAVFNRLKSLLDAGKREEAWEGCLQYVLDNTSAVRDWIGSDTHPATEFYLRDHYFNSGSKNTLKILQRALNDRGARLTVDGLIGPKTRAALRTRLSQGGEHAFLLALRTRRKAFYMACRQFPTFGKGWLSRTDEAFDYALTLIIS
ncbi:hypothetical protein CXU22_03550 [Akkermansia muciniphila]|uniref:Peptidoglycan binding domain-containing protein n=2 Tax=Akkermansia muciniphila TaxID=239935 RepID=A0A2N8HF23_9BACT|nr:hypothetical protein CXU22_03550 [Akkermansia muciniphila]